MNNYNQIKQQNPRILSCLYRLPSPYEANELWSLQKAFSYGCNLLIGKLCTLSHWLSSLTLNFSSLFPKDRANMVNYATRDVMIFRFFIIPITERWTFDKITNRMISEMFVACKSAKLPLLSTTMSIKKKIKNIDRQSLSKNANIY